MLSFIIIGCLTTNPWAPVFVAASIALSPNLVFHASVTYYETLSLLWVFFAVLFFSFLVNGRSRTGLWLVLFWFSAIAAVSCHERMAGYFVLSVPFSLLSCYTSYRNVNNYSIRKTCGMLCLYLALSVAFMLLVNNIFFAGYTPFMKYFKFKSSAIIMVPERLQSIWGFTRNQIGCQGHTVRLVFWNLAGFTFVLAVLGMWNIWKTRNRTSMSLLLFPIGYQCLSVGLVGWTSGRYILGQSIFATILAGLGIEYLFSHSASQWYKNMARCSVAICLVSQLCLVMLVKIADTFFHPRRVVEEIVLQNPGKRIGMSGFEISNASWCNMHNVDCVVIGGNHKDCSGVDILVTPLNGNRCVRSPGGRVVVRKPPSWLASLVRKKCYLYSDGPEGIRIER